MSDITLTIPDWKYKKTLERINTLKTALRFFKINENFKKAFIDDVCRIEDVIKQGKKETHHEMVRDDHR